MVNRDSSGMAAIGDGRGPSVADFYAGRTVFVTGGTGFMGKVLLEKLLRSCPAVARVYLLIRPKRGNEAADRLHQLLASPLFELLRKERPQDLQKVLPIEGDITQPELAINEHDRNLLARTVNVVFHSAATVKFDEKLKLSVRINMLGTQRLIELCRKMENLQALVHVSTAYCNCDRNEVNEVIYPPVIPPDQISSLVEALPEEIVDSVTPQLVGNRPNTYTFTKALAECWLQENKGDLPLVIVRPSIVLSSINGPMKGWVDNWNGPTGIIAASGKGLFRTMLCDGNKVADFIPVDMVINLMIVSAWRVATMSPVKEIPIYNCVTGLRKPITWGEFTNLSFKYMRTHPFSQLNWYPDGSLTKSRTVNMINKWFLHWIPAYFIDSLVWLSGGKPIMVKIQDKLSKAAKCLEYFTTQDWKFSDGNVRILNEQLADPDRREFCFDVSKINWEDYIENYVLGIRRFIFKEDTSSIGQARKQVSRLYWSYRCMQVVAVLCLWHFLTLRFAPLREIWSRALRVLLRVAGTLSFM